MRITNFKPNSNEHEKEHKKKPNAVIGGYPCAVQLWRHVGDSNYNAEQYTITKNIDVFIPRYAVNALTENNVIGKITEPKYVLLSHILELTHVDTEASRRSVEMGLERASRIDCENTYMPMWGEKMTWKDGKLN